jgi:hypothetical protein
MATKLAGRALKHAAESDAQPLLLARDDYAFGRSVLADEQNLDRRWLLSLARAARDRQAISFALTKVGFSRSGAGIWPPTIPIVATGSGGSDWHWGGDASP